MTAHSKPEKPVHIEWTASSSWEQGYDSGLAEGFRRGVQAAADTCEEYRDELEANGTHLVAIAARTCVNRIRALRPEGEKT